MPTSTVTSKGQVTIPKEIRKLLQVGQGDQVDFVVEGPDRVIVRKLGRSIMDLYGILGRPGRKPLTVRQMDRAIARHHAQENARSKRGRR